MKQKGENGGEEKTRGLKQHRIYHYGWIKGYKTTDNNKGQEHWIKAKHKPKPQTKDVVIVIRIVE